jgi:hypothetical protein
MDKIFGWFLGILFVLVVVVVVFRIARPTRKAATVIPTPTPVVQLAGPPLTISYPRPEQRLDLPLKIQGTVGQTPTTIGYRVKDNQGNVLVDDKSDRTGPNFLITSYYSASRVDSGVIEIFLVGSAGESDKVIIPVVLNKDNFAPVKVFFYKDTCDNLAAVSRRAYGAINMAAFAYNQIFAGPTTQEHDYGFKTSLQPGTGGNLQIKNGYAVASLSSKSFMQPPQKKTAALFPINPEEQKLPEEVSAECNSKASVPQIQKTLNQFSDVQNIVVQVDGKVPSDFQP